MNSGHFVEDTEKMLLLILQTRSKDIDDKEHNILNLKARMKLSTQAIFKFLNIKIGERNEGIRKFDQTASSLAVKT